MAGKRMIMRWMIYNTDGCYKIDDNEMHIGDNEMLMLSDELELVFFVLCKVDSYTIRRVK